jgi:transposase
MKKYSTYIGMDCGDRQHRVVVLDSEGEELTRKTLRNRRQDVRDGLDEFPSSMVAIEVGTHSRWLQQELEEAGHTVIVANSRKLPAITRSSEKTDWRDAEMLARLVRFDPKLLFPIEHRGEQAQAHLAVLKARDAVVRARTSLVNCVRGLLKSGGYRAPSCSADAFAKRTGPMIPEELTPALEPLVETIGELTQRIRQYDGKLTMLAEHYPEVELLRKVPGVGPITALAYALTIEDPRRFRKSRKVGAYLGLTPRKDQSGEVDKELRITKHGDEFLRRLLVSAGQYILGPLNKHDSALRQFGLRLAQGGKRAKKRAVVAVARKLAVLLHRLWVTGEVYEAFPGQSQDEAA